MKALLLTLVELQELEGRKAAYHIVDEAIVRDYYDLRQQLDLYTKDMRDVISHPNYSLPFMQPGRLVRIKHQNLDFGWGAVVNFVARKPDKHQKAEDIIPQESYVVDVLLEVADSSMNGTKTHQQIPQGIRPPLDGEKSRMDVVPVLLSCTDAISLVKILLPDDLRPIDVRNNVRKSLKVVQEKFPDGVPHLDPIENMGIRDDSFKKLLRKIEVLESRLLSNSLYNSPRLPELYNQYAEKVQVQERIKAVKKQISTALSIMQLEELKCRKRVLRRFGYINDAEVVQLKARVACEISTGDELLLSELLFDRFFNELSPEICASVLSCFIFEEKAEQASLKEELAKPLREIQAKARIISKVSQESKLPLNEDEYVQGFKWQLMEVVHAWAHGKTFAEICKMTDVYEGSLIRLFRRLEELLRQMAQAAKVMGSDELEQKFEEALKKVRRDIVAAQSLYL